MATAATIADRTLGYAGLFLIGSISWAVDHLDRAHRPARTVPARMVSRPRVAPDRAFRPGVSVPVTQRTSG